MEVPTALLCLDVLDMRPFPNLISHERALQVKGFEVSTSTVWETVSVSSNKAPVNKMTQKGKEKHVLVDKAKSYLILSESLERCLTLEMAD